MLKIGDKEYKEIQVVDEENTLLASITDSDIIEHKKIKVVCVPNN